jgi:hypothetical protein
MPSIPIYHITHVGNLERIICTQGLWCDAERVRQGFDSVGIAYQSLKQRRSRTLVRKRLGGAAVAAAGTLDDYVPFYFANRSPMLYAIHAGHVEGYTDGQQQVIYLVTTVQEAVEGDRRWAFTDGHPVEELTEFYDNLDDLNKIDWHRIEHWSWRNTETDPDRKRRKQAEFLVHRSVPWNWLDIIAVVSQAMARRVRQVLDETKVEHRPRVAVEPRWYYDG